MGIFDRAITDIFGCGDFLEDCLIGDCCYKCICSPIDDSVVYGDIGAVDDVNFTLSIRLPVGKTPSRGQRVRFRNALYKVSDVTYDSANTSIALHLQSVSKG